MHRCPDSAGWCFRFGRRKRVGGTTLEDAAESSAGHYVTRVTFIWALFLYALSNKVDVGLPSEVVPRGPGEGRRTGLHTCLLLQSVVSRKSRVSLLRTGLVQRLAAEPCETFREYDRCFHARSPKSVRPYT